MIKTTVTRTWSTIGDEGDVLPRATAIFPFMNYGRMLFRALTFTVPFPSNAVPTTHSKERQQFPTPTVDYVMSAVTKIRQFQRVSLSCRRMFWETWTTWTRSFCLLLTIQFSFAGARLQYTVSLDSLFTCYVSLGRSFCTSLFSSSTHATNRHSSPEIAAAAPDCRECSLFLVPESL